MNTQQQTDVGDFLNNAQREQNDSAKTWWWVTRGLQLTALFIGVVITVWNTLPAAFSIVPVLLSVGSVITQWVSDHRKGRAQAIHRKFEFLDALGWEVSPPEIRNLHVTLPKGVKVKLDQSPKSPYSYFASKTPRSPRRLMENLTESTFFSQHLAMRSAKIFGFITFAIFLVAVVILLIVLQVSPSQSVGIVTAKIFVALIGFNFTAGFFRLTYDFYRFSQTSNRAEENACLLLKQNDVKLEEAIKLYHEYQLARANSPFISTILWKSMRDELNKRWEQYDQPIPILS